jgi:hypothetical protein
VFPAKGRSSGYAIAIDDEPYKPAHGRLLIHQIGTAYVTDTSISLTAHVGKGLQELASLGEGLRPRWLAAAQESLEVEAEMC